MKNKKIIKRALPFALACVSTVMLTTGCQNKTKSEVTSSASVVEYSASGNIIDGVIYLNSDEVKILEIYNQINETTNYYFVKPFFNYNLDATSAKNIALLRFIDSELQHYINSSDSSYNEDSYESIFKEGVYLWIDKLSVDASPYYAEHKYTNIKGKNFYHIQIDYLIEKNDDMIKNDIQTYTRLDDVLYQNDNEVFKIKVFNFNDMYEKGLYTYDELQAMLANLNKDKSRILTNK